MQFLVELGTAMSLCKLVNVGSFVMSWIGTLDIVGRI
jgi:hypothetical protein